ncbi:MAG: hypothetical protein U1F56_00210 [Rubrivivax sp.]
MLDRLAGLRRLCILAGLLALSTAQATVVARYGFQNTLAADQAGAPALVAIDPLGLNGFETATVHGQSQTVYRFSGVGDPSSSQAGLSLSTTGLVDPSRYVLSMTFEIFEPAAFGGGWIRLVDTEARQSDNGLYLSPTPQTVVTTVQNTENDPSGDVHQGSTTAAFRAFHDLVLSVMPGATAGTQVVNVWLDGLHEIVDVGTDRFSLDNVNNPNQLLVLFADNRVSQAQLEFASGRIASLTLDDGLQVPAPGSLALLSAAALVAMLAPTRRRRGAGAAISRSTTRRG